MVNCVSSPSSSATLARFFFSRIFAAAMMQREWGKSKAGGQSLYGPLKLPLRFPELFQPSEQVALNGPGLGARGQHCAEAT
jgi:hypothetical protein